VCGIGTISQQVLFFVAGAYGKPTMRQGQV
jgi:hypothetical protein